MNDDLPGEKVTKSLNDFWKLWRANNVAFFDSMN